jgi:PST family polysaccharide transporter
MLSKKIAISSAILAFARFLTVGLDLVLIAILARFLTPEDFGLVALANSVLLILRAISNQPLADVLVQRDTIEDRDLRAAFTLSVARGALMSLFLVSLALPMAHVYNDDRLIPMMCVLAIAPFCRGLMSPAMVHFSHAVNYLPLTITQISARVSTFLVAVLIGVMTQSYWALIIGGVVSPAASTIVSYILAPWKPQFGRAGAMNILSFIGWVTFSQFISTLNANIDRFFIGAILGKTNLGRYTVADDLSTAATFSFAGPLSNALFAGFSRLKGERDRLRNAYIKGQEILVAGLLPLGCGLAVLASPVVNVILTPEWHETKWLIAIIAPIVALQTTIIGVQSVSMALGQPRMLAIRESIAFVLRVPLTIWAAWQFGLIGAAIARAIAGVIIVYINMRIANLLLDISVSKQITTCARSLLSALIMTGALWLFQSQATVGWKSGYVLLVGVPLGAVIYIACHFLAWWVMGCPDSAETRLLGVVRSVLKRFFRS